MPRAGLSRAVWPFLWLDSSTWSMLSGSISVMSGFRRAAVVAIASALICSLSQAKQQAWVEVRSPNFIVVSNAGEKAARKAAAQFEQIRTVFRQSLSGVSKHPSPLVTVLAVKDEGSMRELLPEYWAKGRAHPAGLFAGRLNQLYAAVELDARGATPYETFYHEYYHAISIPYFPDLPVWLGEGLAEFYGHTEIDEKFVGIGEADSVLIQQLRYGSFIPLNVLFQVDRSSPYYNEANKTSTFYAESWALAHYLLFGDRMAHRDMLDAYVNALAQGKKQDVAAAEAFGDFKKLQSDLQAYIRRDSFLYSKTPAPTSIQEDELKVRPLTQAEADGYRGGFAAIRGRTEDATAILEQAIRLDPNTALAHQYLGITQFIEGKREQAVESESRAIALDPRNSFTRYLRAFLTTGGTGVATEDPQIEEDLRQAIAISPDFSPPYGLLAVYLAANNRNLPEALSLVQKAMASEPGSSNYQLAMAQVLLRMNKLDESGLAAARASALAKDAAEKGNAESFGSYLQRMRQYQKEEAARDAQEEKVAEKVQAASGSEESPRASEATASTAREVQIQASISIVSAASGTDLTPYLKGVMETVRERLASNVTDLPLAKQRSLALEFAILRDGKIAGLTVVLSSGDAALDRIARESVATAAPFRALPTGLKQPSLRLHFGLSCSPQE